MLSNPEASPGPSANARDYGRGKPARQVFGILGTRVVVLCIGIVSGILVTRALGPRNRGMLAFVYVLFAYSSVFSLGFGAGVRYLVASREFRPRDIALTVVGVNGLLGGGAGSLLYFLWLHGALGKVGRDLPGNLMVPIVLTLPFIFVADIATRLMIGDSRFGVSNLLQIGRQAALAILLFLAVVVGGLGVKGAIAALVAVHVLAAFVALVALVALYKPVLRLHSETVRRSFSYGIKSWLGGLANRGNQRLDQLLLGLFASATSLGLYAIAVRVAELPLLLVDVSVPVLFNRVAGLEDPGRRARLVEQLHRAYLVVISAVCLGIAVSAPFVVPALYGKEFAGSVVPLLLYLPGVLFQVSWRTVGPYFLATNRPSTSSAIQFFGLLVAVPCYSLFIPRWGVAGAAMANSLTYLACAAGALWFYGRSEGFRASAFFRPRLGDLMWVGRQVAGAARLSRVDAGAPSS